jgi:hypothetical protein
MNRYSTENYKMLTRVADFAANNGSLLNKSTVSMEIQTLLKAAVGDLAGLSSSRRSAESTLRSTRDERVTARVALRGLLDEAELTARALNKKGFRSPRRPSDHELIEAGRTSAAEVASLKKAFSVNGPSTEEVIPAVQALERAVSAYATARAKRSAALQEFGGKLEIAMRHLKRLDALVAITLAGNTSAMTEWTAARTVNRPPSRRKAAVEPQAA